MKETATPADREVAQLFGGYHRGGFTATRDQMTCLARLYRFDPPKRSVTHRERWNESGMARNLFRHAEHDGLRVMAYLARFLEPGEDPVELVARLCADAGYDCPEFGVWEE